MIYQGKARAPVREAILHCAAVKTGKWKGAHPFEVFAEVNRWHRDRGFSNGFGYHGLIMPDGGFYAGRPLDMIGAHCQGRNTGTLGILLVESREITEVGQFDDWFTLAQRDALKRLLASLTGIDRVSGHNDWANRLCPGFKVRSADWL